MDIQKLVYPNKLTYLVCCNGEYSKEGNDVKQCDIDEVGTLELYNATFSLLYSAEHTRVFSLVIRDPGF